MSRLRIIIDTREQRPWAFPLDKVTATRRTLKTGDYALVDDDAFAIERKSLDDFLSTISSGWERFLREIGRMEGAGFVARVVIIESDFDAICFHEDAGTVIAPQHRHPRLTPPFVAKRCAELLMMGVSVVFAGNAGYAAALAYAVLRERLRSLEEDMS